MQNSESAGVARPSRFAAYAVSQSTMQIVEIISQAASLACIILLICMLKSLSFCPLTLPALGGGFEELVHLLDDKGAPIAEGIQHHLPARTLMLAGLASVLHSKLVVCLIQSSSCAYILAEYTSHPITESATHLLEDHDCSCMAS